MTALILRWRWTRIGLVRQMLWNGASHTLGGLIDGWSVGSAVLMRTQISDERDGVRVARIEHRVRVLAN